MKDIKTAASQPFFSGCMEIWFDFYEALKGIKPTVDGAQGKALKLILQKIETKAREFNYEPDNNRMELMFQNLLFSIDDKWILDNLQLTLINSKFDILIVKAINAKKANGHSQVRVAETLSKIDELYNKSGATNGTSGSGTTSGFQNDPNTFTERTVQHEDVKDELRVDGKEESSQVHSADNGTMACSDGKEQRTNL